MPKALLPLNEADRLKALRSYQILDTAYDNTFDNLVRLAARITGCPTALISFVDEDRQWFKARLGQTATETSRDAAFCAHTILDPAHPLIVNDATADARFADNPLVTADHGIRFYAGMPLVTPNGHALGSLCVIDYAPRRIDPACIDLLQGLALAVISSLELRKAAAMATAMADDAVSRFAQVIEALPTAVVLTGSDGRLRMINQGTERLFGYKRAELQGGFLEILVPERHRQLHVQLRQGFMKDMSSRIMGAGKALFGRRKDGSEFPLEIGLNPIDFDGDRMTLAAVSDISERHAIELERQERAKELMRNNADLLEFAYAASHDLRAPLRAIGHLAEWIREDVGPIAAPETLENLGLLQGRVARLQALLDGMLAYSRLGATDLAAETVETCVVVREIVTMIDLPPGFSVECVSDTPPIRTHASPIKTVLRNLISNGLRHHDRETGRITVSMQVRDGMAEFRVSDDGPGIPPEFQERIFRMFETLQSRDDREASGIGLAIVRKAVTDHGGTIRVASNPPERGTTFVFTWKVDNNEQQTRAHPAG
jgi:PAS domain S-box-containing protein